MNLLEIINKLLDGRIEYEKEKRKIFVQDIYKEIEIVYNDYMKLLYYVYSKIMSGEMSIDDAVKYFNEKRLPFKSSRSKIRGFIKNPYYQRNEDLVRFAIGIAGVLQGGLHTTTRNMVFYRRKEQDIFLDKTIEFKGYHTIVHLIGMYDRNDKKSLFYSDLRKQANSEEIIRYRLIEDIKKQMRAIDEAWQLVCDYYPKLIL